MKPLLNPIGPQSCDSMSSDFGKKPDIGNLIEGFSKIKLEDIDRVSGVTQWHISTVTPSLYTLLMSN